MDLNEFRIENKTRKSFINERIIPTLYLISTILILIIRPYKSYEIRFICGILPFITSLCLFYSHLHTLWKLISNSSEMRNRRSKWRSILNTLLSLSGSLSLYAIIYLISFSRKSGLSNYSIDDALPIMTILYLLRTSQKLRFYSKRKDSKYKIIFYMISILMCFAGMLINAVAKRKFSRPVFFYLCVPSWFILGLTSFIWGEISEETQTQETKKESSTAMTFCLVLIAFNLIIAHIHALSVQRLFTGESRKIFVD